MAYEAIRVGMPATIVKKITVGTPISGSASSGSAGSIHNIDGTLTGQREHGHILIFDSSRDQPNPNYRTSAILAGSGLNKNLNVDNYNPILTFNIDSAELQNYFRPTIRGYFSGQGDLTYDSATGVFSFDVENLYTQSNFDSDLGAALAGGVGITYDSSSDTINITDTGVDSGQYGTATLIPVLTINSRGQIDSAGSIAVAGVSSTAWDSSLSKYTISTADGGSFPTIINGWSDNQPIYFGDSNDLKIYHSGSHSYIEDNGTGSLIVATNNLTIKNATQTENQITALSGGAVTLYHNDSAKLLTTDSGATITGSLRADSATITNINRMGTTITAGTYGTAVKIPRITIDSSGFIDSAGEVDVAGVSSVSFDSASYNYTINTADGGVFTQMIHTRKPGLAAGTHGSEVLVPQITINEYGLVDSIGTTQVAGVSSTSFDSAAGIFTINTADGGVFNTTLIDSDFTRTRVRSSLSASGDLTYDSATGVFSFDVEDVYTKSNFDSDFNIALDSAVLEGVGLTYNDTTNTLDIDSAELQSYFRQDIRGYFTASNSLGYSSATGDFRLPQPLDSAANPTFNQLRGPAEFIIDPAAIGDSTGTVRILGNLRVDGVQTTINSTAVSVADKNIIIADSAADSAGLNGGGFTWGGDAIVDNPTFTYSHSDARFVSNRNIQADSFIGTISSLANHTTTNLAEGTNQYYTEARVDTHLAADRAGNITRDGLISMSADSNTIHTLGKFKIGSPTADHMYISHVDNNTTSNYALLQSPSGLTSISSVGTLYFNNSNITNMVLNDSGNVGIGELNPSDKLRVVGTTSTSKLRITDTDDVTLASTTHPFQIGPTSGVNMAIDGNEIMARNNGANSPLYLQALGGQFTVGNVNFPASISLYGPIMAMDGALTLPSFAGGTNEGALQVFTSEIDSSNLWNDINADGNNYSSMPSEISISNLGNNTTNSFSGLFMMAGETTNNNSVNAARIGAIREGSKSTALGFAVRQSGGDMVEVGRFKSTKQFNLTGDIELEGVNYITTLTKDSATAARTITFPDATGTVLVGGLGHNPRNYFSGQGDISYDSATGVFSLDVETVYTSSNFDSDLLDAGYDDLDQSLLADSSIELTQNLTTYPIYDYSKTTYRSSKHLVQATKGSKYQISEILLVHDGSTVHMTEYGKICIGDSSLAYYDASIVGDNVQLKAQPVEASTIFKSHNTLIKV
jgi:hypothetical protein